MNSLVNRFRLCVADVELYVRQMHELSGDSIVAATIWSLNRSTMRADVTLESGEVCNWEVWLEPLLDGSLYGEC